MDNPEVVIAGAGPAGLTAGLYAARAGHRALIIERALPGGQVANTPEVENYPGFAEPVVAFELAQAMQQQAERAGAEILTAEVTGLARDPLVVRTSAGDFRPGAVIVSSGVQGKELGLPGEKELRGRGVSYCAICDGPLFKGKTVAVVGGGDSALDEALYLAGICSKVFLVHRRDEFRGAQVAQDRVRAAGNIELVLSHVVSAINGTAKLESIEVESRKDNSKRLLEVAGLFIYVGSTPNTAWCRDTVELDQGGFVKSDRDLRTNVPGVFTAGDVRVTPLRQIATAVGDGALAGMMAHHWLGEHH
ncbi:thioredoxin-disulfide reductase [candidate division WOR-3 bacterium]|nr:thioredoxin-disulfide reductase [candidate division WOR-3 bacterium]